MEGGRVRRRLTEIEYFNWCVDQPYNIAVAVRLRGRLSPAGIRTALDKAQQRHPMLAVNTTLDALAAPWLDSDGVGTVPMEVLERTGDDDALRVLDVDLVRPFPMDATGPRDPLVRLTVLVPPDPDDAVDVVICAQHVVADGLSMLFLVRDLLRFLQDPDAGVEVLPAPASAAPILPVAVRHRVARSPRRLRAALALLRLYQRLPWTAQPSATLTQGSVPVHSWRLTADQTRSLLNACRAEGVSVQSALCTAFLPSYTAINSPVNLRGRLAREVGEAVGLYVGAAIVRARYADARGFWSNARAFHRRFRRALRDPFRVFRICSPAVPREELRDFGTAMMALIGRRRPLGVSNLGSLDGLGLDLDGDGLRVESIHGGASGFTAATLLTTYTIGGTMRFHLRGTPDMTLAQTVAEAERAMALLLPAVAAAGAAAR
jgi:hypothetical protein